MRRILSIRNFRLLFAGTSLSVLGDQFALIATPWLALALTGDALTLGIVLALEGLPRAAFLLVGGAVTDRLSPRRMMVIADGARLAMVMTMAIAVLTGSIDPWMLYAFSLGLGIAAGMALPAERSIVPTLLSKTDLQAGNALIMGMMHIAGFVGPSLAGIMIGTSGGTASGVGTALVIDAASFAASLLCLILIRGQNDARLSTKAPRESVLDSIHTAWRHVWRDPALRLMFLLLAAINFLMIGPLLVGIPLLASTRLPEGVVAYGMLMSAFSGGNLMGFVAAGALPWPGALVIRIMVIGLLAGFGIVVGCLGLPTSTLTLMALLFVLGAGNGYLAILLVTWLQTRTPEHMLGRVMSFLLLANTGLIPASQALSGAIGQWNLDALFAGAGVLSLAVTLWAATRQHFTLFTTSLAANAAHNLKKERP
ncbi:MFS transporter [Magnetospira sp. QH-2]|uniref:MFS transporter n=1 Tax=Magnetospira sp. (strain QH-2) TaxID=1288970 RepID=UPI000698F88A|nr:MFS transporter [Magnetospira sp. QH-2]